MTVGILFLLAALAGFGLLGIFHKVADHPDCRPKIIAVILLFWGGVLTTVYTALFQEKGLSFPPEVLSIGALGGVFSGLALLAFQTGLRHGKISTSWLVINLSMSVPILLSVFAFREEVSPIKAGGILLVLAAIILMWRDKRLDMDKAALDGKSPVLNRRSKWLPLMLLAFVANGLAASSQKILVESGAGEYAWQFYIVLYWAGFALMAVLSLLREGWPNRREFQTAFVMAICSVLGNVSLTLALNHGVPGSVAFPVGNGGSLTLVVLAGVLFFRERIHRVGVLGILFGISAIIILVLA
jgi:drug/metabolite transporter (DMT)-like permease